MIHPNIVPITKRNQPTVRQNDHTILTGLIAERRLEAKTLIIDAKNHDRHEALRIDAQNDGRALWLDTQALELSLPFGVSDSHRELPWAELAGARKGLSSASVVRFAETVADFVGQGAYQGVLAPRFGHFLDHVYAPLCDMLSRAGEVVETFHEAHRRSLSIKEMLTTHLQDANNAFVLQRVPRSVRPLAQVVRLPMQENTGKSES